MAGPGRPRNANPAPKGNTVTDPSAPIEAPAVNVEAVNVLNADGLATDVEVIGEVAPVEAPAVKAKGRKHPLLIQKEKGEREAAKLADK
jgi:hypothetical protein